MLELFGRYIDPRDATNLASALRADGSPDALAAATQITAALEAPSDVELTPNQREAIRAVLSKPDSQLDYLRDLAQRDPRGPGVE